MKHPLIDDQSIKFPIFVFDHKNPLAVIDPIIAKIFSLKNEDNITPLKQAIDSSLSQRQLMFHLDALANNKILIKDTLSPRKAIYRINQETLKNKDVLFNASFNKHIISIFPHTMHCLPFFNPFKQILKKQDFLYDVVSDIQSASISNWYPSSKRMFEFAIYFSTLKGTINTVKDLQVITVIHSLLFDIFRVKLFLEKEYDFVFSDDELMSARIKVGNIVKYFNDKHSLVYAQRIIDSLDVISRLTFRLSKKIGDKTKAQVFKPYSLSFNNNYTLLESFNIEENPSITSYVEVKLPAYYVEYFRWLNEEVQDGNIQPIPFDMLFLKNETQSKMKMMLINLCMLSANCEVPLREFLRMVLCTSVMRRYPSRSYRNKIIADFVAVLMTFDDYKAIGQSVTGITHTCTILNKRHVTFDSKSFYLSVKPITHQN